MLNQSIKLTYNYGYKWFEKDNVKVKGWVIDDSGIVFEDDALPQYFLDIDSVEKLKYAIGRITGHFLVVIKTKSGLLFASDRCRSFTLYYAIENSTFYLSDSSFLREKIELNLSSVEEYLSIGFVSGSSTLFKSVNQIELGDIYQFNESAVNTFPYFQYLTKTFSSLSFSEACDVFEKVLDKVFIDLIHALNDRMVVIPLSGGYDSRLIVAMFRRHGYRNVTCYSFGKNNNPEMIISRKVSDALGYPWYFFETTPDVVKNFSETDEFEQYVDFAANAGSFYIIQDYFAVKKMYFDNTIPKNSVFMPGHSGDTLGGSNFLGLLNGNENSEEIIDKVLKFKYNLSPSSLLQKKYFRGNIKKQIKDYDGNTNLWFDWFSIRESHSKMFVNAVRVYDFFGYKYFLPLWDKNIVEFFRKLPVEFKQNKKLYDHVLENRIFKPLNVNFIVSNGLKREGFLLSFIQAIKCSIKFILPKSIVFRYFAFDPINGKVYAYELFSAMKKKGVRMIFSNTNAVKAQWYIRYLEQKTRKS